MNTSNYWHQPDINPVLIRFNDFIQIRWYSLLYVGGFLVGRSIAKHLAKDPRAKFTGEDIEEFVLWALIGAVIGARVIYCTVYDPKALLANPFYLFQIYKGGLSFHGGFLGTIVAGIVFTKKKGIPFFNLCDAVCISATVGLAMGRLGNFINGELYGRVSYVPWAIIFKQGGTEPRHPSQLYELVLEGIVTFCVLMWARRYLKKDGQISVLFMLLYTVARFVTEYFREPDAHIGYLMFGLSMGQILSLVMLLATMALAWYVWFAKKHEPEPVVATGKKKKKR